MGQYVISGDPERLDREWVHKVISTDTYWAEGRSRERNDRAIENSLCYGVYHDSGRQLGFARVVTDLVSFAWLCDVYIDRETRGNGIGKRLIAHVLDDLDRRELRRVVLATQGAEEFYRRFDFAETDDDLSTWMIRRRPDRT